MNAKIVRFDVTNGKESMSIVINTDYFVRAISDGSQVYIAFVEKDANISFTLSSPEEASKCVDKIWTVVG